MLLIMRKQNNVNFYENFNVKLKFLNIMYHTNIINFLLRIKIILYIYSLISSIKIFINEHRHRRPFGYLFKSSSRDGVT